MRMYAVRPSPLDPSRTRKHQAKKKERNKAPFPMGALQVGEDAAILDKGFNRLRSISKSVDRYTIHDLITFSSRGMRANDMNVEFIDKAPIQFMYKARFIIATPPRIG